jgi:hypothetical protein
MIEPIKIDVRLLTRRLDPARAYAKVLKVVKRWAYSEGLEVIAAALPDVPVDVGALKSTGFAERPVMEGETVIVRLGFGGVAGPPFNKVVGYAWHVHERLDVRHPHGHAKYLETPWVLRKPIAVENLAKMLRGVV